MLLKLRSDVAQPHSGSTHATAKSGKINFTGVTGR